MKIDDDTLVLIDEAMATLQRLRERVAREMEPEPDTGDPVGDEDDLVDTWTASTRFNLPVDSIRWLARNKGMGVKERGRWLVSVKALRRYLDSRPS